MTTTMRPTTVLSYLLFFTCLICHHEPGYAARILTMPFIYKSHVTQLVTIGDTLLDNGHDVYMLMSPSFPDYEKLATGRIKLIDYNIMERDVYGMPQHNVHDLFISIMGISSSIEDYRTNVDGFIQFCTNPLSDNVLFDKLKALNFDLAVVDVCPNSRCLLILLYRLGIPYVSLTTTYEPWLQRVPALPSFVPFPLAGQYTEEMSFLERLHNTLVLLDWTAFPRVPSVDDQLVVKYAPEMPQVTLNYLAGRSLLLLFNTDVIIDYPRPMMANEVNIGGISTRPAKALPIDLAKFLDSATEGAIVVSFGSMDFLPPNIYEKLMAAFVQLEQKVIWRYKFDFPVDVAENIRLMKWVPQNDILAHVNTKLMITHGGGNSQFEALYHGVAVLSIPILSDQPYNAKRVEYHGFGITMDLRTFMPDQLVRNIHKIINNQSYTQNIQKRSEIFHGHPMKPCERAVFWIEHVLKFGGDHLHSNALDMPWYQYLMIDIMALLLTFGVLSVYILCQIFKLACQEKDKEKMD